MLDLQFTQDAGRAMSQAELNCDNLTSNELILSKHNIIIMELEKPQAKIDTNWLITC